PGRGQSPVLTRPNFGQLVGPMHAVARVVRWPIQLSWLFALAILAALAWSTWSRRTRLGLELRAVGLQPESARLDGVPDRRRAALILLASGAVAGLVGLYPLLSLTQGGRVDLTKLAMYGVFGVGIAFAGRACGLGVVVAAVVFSFLGDASAAISAATT